MAEILLIKTEHQIFFIIFENLKNYKIQRNSGHCTRRCACRTYYEVKIIKYIFTLISTLSLILCYLGRSKRERYFQNNCTLYIFTHTNLCLILTFLCCAGNNVNIKTMVLQQTGTTLDISNLATHCVSIGQSTDKLCHITWTV